ncbi:hypothetical protein Droror1_Dr00017753, partial [Drosera rotundifolia]
MADALRKLRVEELKREVQQRDASIVSLELKVKKFEEEREKTSKTMVDDVEGGTDLIVLESVAAYDKTQNKMAFFDPSRPQDFLFIYGTKALSSQQEVYRFNVRTFGPGVVFDVNYQARQSLIVRGLFSMLADPRHP